MLSLQNSLRSLSSLLSKPVERSVFDSFDDNDKLRPGTKLALASGKSAIVIKWVAEGSQGNIYKCLVGQRIRCLKIFKPGGATTPEQKRHIVQYAAEGRPAKTFVKIHDIVLSETGDLPAGYAMQWCDTGELDGITGLTQHTPLPSLRMLVDQALLLILSLKALHARGLAYLDMSAANVLFDFRLGRRLLLLDPDNITPDGVQVGVYGTLGCIAPEIIKQKAPPSVLTDLFRTVRSISV